MAYFRCGGGENVTPEATTQKANIELLGKQIAQVQLENNEIYVWGKYTSVNGDLLDFVYSENSSAYPEEGTQSGYYYKVMRPVLVGIEVTTQPTKLLYTTGEGFDSTGMVVTATYDIGITKEVAGFSTTPSTFASAGNQTVTVSYVENGVTKTDTLTVSVIAVGDFATSTWSEIQSAVQAGISGLDLSKVWSVGDTKSVTLTTGESIELQIADFNHDAYNDGVIAPVTFVMKDCLGTAYSMNSSSTNSGGYPASAMRTTVANQLYEKLPSDLKSIVAPVKKKCYIGTTTTLEEITDNVWLLAEIEVLGSNSYSAGTGEGTKYAIFTDNTSRIKKRNGSACWWWLRSPISGSSGGFCFVNSGGSAGNYNYASTSYGLVVGLCIR